MKFNVSSGFKNKEQVRNVAADLKKVGWHHTYDWTQNKRANTLEDLQQIGILEKEAVAKRTLFSFYCQVGKELILNLGWPLLGKKYSSIRKMQTF